MPSLSPSYLYTLAATLIVGTLLTGSFAVYTSSLDSASELSHIRDLIDMIAAEGTRLVTLAEAANATYDGFVQMPGTIGRQQYWISLHSESEKAWVEAGFGTFVTSHAGIRAYLPQETVASGHYISGTGAIQMVCHIQNLTVFLDISSWFLESE